MFNISNRATSLLSPHQLGVGVEGGLQAIIHSLKHIFEQKNDEVLVLQVDLTNAFNCCDRDLAFQEVEKLFPACLKWVLTCYKNEAQLNFGNRVISSRTGFHQGDLLASLLFSLTLHPIIKNIKRELPALILKECFFDDGILAGTRQELQTVVDIMLEQGPPRGLYLSKQKSSVWSPSIALTLDPLGRQIPSVEEEGIIVLGSTVSSIEFEKRIIEERIQKVKMMCERLSLMQDAQAEYTILRSCLSLPKLMFSLRTSYSLVHMNVWHLFDSIIRATMSEIRNTIR